MSRQKQDDGEAVPELPAEGEDLTTWESRRKRIQKDAFREALVEFGFNPAEPLEIQQDQAWVRRRRKLEESMTAKVIGAILTFLVPGALGAFAASFFAQR